MALDHTMLLGVYNAGGVSTMLRVSQGAKATTSTRQNVASNPSTGSQYGHRMIVYNGNVYIPTGSSGGTNNGWMKYNPILDEFEIMNYHPITARFIPLFDRVGWAGGSEQGWGYSPEHKVGHVSDLVTMTPADVVTVGNNVFLLAWQNALLFSWAYPFTAAPTSAALSPSAMYRMAELNGDVYAVNVNTVGGTLDLYRIVGGAFGLVGTPSAHANLTPFAALSSAAGASLFKFNGKLFLILHGNDITVEQKLRLFEMDTSTGGSTERNSYLPTEWGSTAFPPATNQGVVFEVRDDIGANEQVFIVRAYRNLGGWECYQFQEGSFIQVITGQADQLYPYSGAIYDPDAKAAQIKSAADSVPSSFVRMGVETYDLKGQGAVDIDPRYRLNGAEPPPYAVCTGKPPNDSKGPFASVPSGITVLADLSDTFAAADVDDDLWQRVSQAVVAWGGATRDWGHGYNSGAYNFHRIQQIGGAIRFGQDGETTVANEGIGVKSRWAIGGGFQIDFTIKDPVNLEGLAALWGNTVTPLVALVKVSPNEGYGFAVWKTSGLVLQIRGFYMPAAGAFVYSADFAVIDGEIVRIARNGSNIWTVERDPNGVGSGAQNLNPGGANYADPVRIVLAALPGSGTSDWVETGTPDGDEPGFSNIDVSGAGALSKYDGSVEHTFDWDHITDEPPPTSGTAELFVDSEA